MAGINPIDYKRASSTGSINESYGVPPQDVPINSSTANAIEKDVQQGNIDESTLDGAQKSWIEAYSTDDNTYTLEESEQVGRNAIDAEGLEDTDWGTEGGRTAEGVGGAGATLVAQPAGQAVQQGLKNNAQKAGTKVVEEQLKGTKFNPETGKFEQGTASDSTKAAAEKAHKMSKIPFAALVAGAIALAGGVMANNSANTFDEQYADRVAKLEESGNTMSTLQAYSDKLNEDLVTIGEDTIEYMSLSEEFTNAQSDKVVQIGILEAEKISMLSQGNMTRAGELQTQIDVLRADTEGDGTIEDLNNLKDSIDGAANYNAEAKGAKESGDSVSAFLQDGMGLGIAATVQCALLAYAGLKMLAGTWNAIKAAASVPDLTGIIKAAAMACAIAGAAMMTAGNALTLVAAYKLGEKAVNEFKAYDSGKDMADTLGTLNESIDANTDTLDESSGYVAKANATSAETVGGTQDATNGANTILAGNTGVQYTPSSTFSFGSTGGNNNGGTV